MGDPTGDRGNGASLPFVGKTMTDDRTARINTAVDTILEHCSQHGPGVLRSCLDGLARNHLWTPEEIEIVRVVVERRLDQPTQE
jgi:hypothetical protein